MNNTSNNDDSHSLSSVQRIDAICDRFELAWIRGERISIDKILEESPTTLRRALARELVAIEMELRRKAGEEPSLAQYAKYSSEEWLQGLRPQVESPNVGSNDATLDVPGTVPTAYGVQAGNTLPQNVVRYFGDYELIREIAHGGMGVVYQARQVSLDRMVAVKMILAGALASKQIVERFQREARAAALLDHPGIVPIYEVGVHNDQHFFSMGYIDGESLATKLAAGPMEAKEAAALVVQISHAIQYAHERGVIHRDIKPSNILLDRRGVPRVTDFGLAKRVDDGAELTVTGQILGTPSYMPPEQAAGQIESVGPESDVYSLGAMLYAMVTGRPPFQAASSVETLRQVIDEEVIPPVQLDRTIPKDLETIILKCLDKSRPRRYTSAQLLREDLERFLEDRSILARPVTSIEKGWRWCRRNPIVAGLSTLVSVLVIGTATLSSIAYLREVALRNDLKQSMLVETKAKEKANEAAIKAESEARKADLARIEKERQATIAEQERAKAAASEAIARRNLYISDMSRVQTLIQDSSFIRAKSLLERHVPNDPKEIDLRGFDWYFQWGKVDQERVEYNFEKSIESLALSKDGKTLAVGCEGGRGYLLDTKDGSLSPFVFSIEDNHWESLAFVGERWLVGHGKRGGFKRWNVQTMELDAYKPATRRFSKHVKIESDNDFDDHIPAVVSGEVMVAGDFKNNLALWDVATMRPRPIPFINEGRHVARLGKVYHVNSFSLDPYRRVAFFPRTKSDEAFLQDKGSGSWTNFYLNEFKEANDYGYHSVGDTDEIDISKLKLNVGHPIRCMQMLPKAGLLVAGGAQGELQVYSTENVADPAKWASDAMLKIPSMKSSIVGIDANELNTHLLVANSQECVVLTTRDWKEVARFQSASGVTKVRFWDNDTIAIGSNDGTVQIGPFADERKFQRFFSGVGSVTGIEWDKTNKKLFVGNSNGKISSFKLVDDAMEIVPLNLGGIGASTFWLPESNRVAISRTLERDVVVVDPASPLGPIKIDLRDKDVRSRNGKQCIDIYDRKNAAEVVCVHDPSIVVLDSRSHRVLRRYDTFVDYNETGRAVPLSMKQHRFVELSIESDVSNGNVSPSVDRGVIVGSAVSMNGNRVAVATYWPGQFRIIVRDIITGAVDSDVRIIGIQESRSRIAMRFMDDERIFVARVQCDSGKKLTDCALIVDTGSMTVSAIDKNERISVEDTEKDNSYQRVDWKHPTDFAIWSKHRIQFFSKDEGNKTKELSRPVDEYFHFVFGSFEEDLYAVMASADKSGFRIAKLDFDKQVWKSIFESKERRKDLEADPRWCFDPTTGCLFRMNSVNGFRRWSIPTGDELSEIRFPTGGVERLKSDNAGLVKAAVKRSLPFTGSAVVFLNKNYEFLPFHPLDALPGPDVGLTPNPGSWISNQRLIHPSSESFQGPNYYGSGGWTVQFNQVPFDMRDFGLSESSRDGMRIFRLEGRVIHHWRFGGIKDDANQKVIEYDYQFGKETDLQESPSRLSISADGSCVAIANDREIQYSSFPFEEWKKIPLDLQPGDSISALRWSDYATKIAIGMSSGDLRLYDSGIEEFQTVARVEPGPINDLLYLPDEKTLATAHDSGAVILWDLEQKEVRLSISAHRGKVNTLEYDNVSNVLYSGGDDGVIRRWASSTYVNRVLAERFQTPKSTDPILEKRSEKSSDELQNRELAKWLTAKGIQVAAMSFGVPREIDLSDESIDEFAICSVSSRDPTKITDEVVEKLAALKELKKLDLSNSKITSKCFSIIETLTSLAWLDLSGIDLTDFDFRELKCSQSLRTLTLNGCNLQDHQLLQIIANSPHLLELSLSANHISQVSIASISSLKSLKALNISASKLDENAILSMKQLSQLEKLVVDDTNLTKEHLVQLLELKLIREFSARRTEADDHWIGRSAKEPRTLLTAWNHISKLDLRDTQVTAVGVSQLLKNRSMLSVLMDPSRFQNSGDLNILSKMGPIQGRIQVNGGWLSAGRAIEALMRTKSARITGIVWPIDPNRSIEDLPHLKQLTQLRRIAVNKNVVPRIHYPLLCQLNQIKHLDLSDEPVIEEPSDYAHIGNMIQLESITIDRKISKERLKSMSKLQQIQSFNDNSSNPIVSVADIAETFPNLKNLVADDVDKKTLEKALPSLQRLETFEIKSGFKSNLGPILVRLPKLKVLDVNKSLTTKELKELKELLPNVEIKHRQ